VKPVFAVSVRDLIEFTLRRGDLGGDRTFSGPSRALAGVRGHQRIQRNRPANYQKEVPVRKELDDGGFILRIQGRIDGVLAGPSELLLEEIKTVAGRWNREADPLHWAQAKIYAHIYSEGLGFDTISLQLTYLNLDTGELTELRENFELAELAGFFNETAGVYLDWMREEHTWRQARDSSIATLDFPYPQYRHGQREMAVAVYRTLASGGRLFLEAPTGIGKTMSVLFPAIKALGRGKLDRIFYLTARTTGRAAAEQALGELRECGLRLRSLTLTAKDKICEQEGFPCEPGACPLARGYYDRRTMAMREALRAGAITRSTLEILSRKHQVCPFELSLDLSVWVEAVVCDYNYVFDPKVYLRRHFAEGTAQCALLTDEAHNLVDRAREMFSARIDVRQIREVRRAIKADLPQCARSLGKFEGAIRKLGQPAACAESSEESAAGCGAAQDLPLFEEPAPSAPASGAFEDGVLVYRRLPETLGPPLEHAIKHAETWLARNEPAEFRELLLELYFQLNSFARTAELCDERHVTLVRPGAAGDVRLFCLDPSRLLREALERSGSAVFFSATLTPIEYYRSLLGGAPEDPVMQLASPFAPENLRIVVHEKIRTEYRSRGRSLDEVTEAVSGVVRECPGNYLVYFPSYQYLERVRERFELLHPSIPSMVQRPSMSDSERASFLEAFSIQENRTIVGFAVMGGIFGEGIDLIGDRLIGVIVVGVGLPQLTTERDLIREYFQETTGAGFEYAYAFPGMNRVLQAAGRVIRSEQDRGVVLLIDSRFSQQRYRNLFPSWWQTAQVNDSIELRKALRDFWGAADIQGKPC
jgi:DNA excision repair protein ERCC-2